MILPILQYGDPILRAKGKRIEQIDDRVRELAVNMIETMHAAHGVGLAAQQIGEALQLTVLDISPIEDRPSTLKLDGKDADPKTAMPLVLINPVVRAQTLEGGTIQVEAGGFLARAIQHEHDHLNGILFIDRMNSAAKAALSSHLRRMQKEARRGRRIRPQEERPLVSETTL